MHSPCLEDAVRALFSSDRLVVRRCDLKAHRPAARMLANTAIAALGAAELPLSSAESAHHESGDVVAAFATELVVAGQLEDIWRAIDDHVLDVLQWVQDVVFRNREAQRAQRAHLSCQARGVVL